MGRWLPRVVGLLLMASAMALALARAPDRSVQSLVARWAPPPSQFIDLHGQLVHLRDEGPRDDALPLVLLHGTSASLHTWEGWSAALRAQRRVITFDLPGFGLTGPFTGRYAAWNYSGDELARFVLELLDELKVPRFALGGNSLGGEVAWRVAALAPQRVQRLVLVDAAGYELRSESVPIGFRLANVPGINRTFEYLLPRGLVEASVREVYGDPGKVTPALGAGDRLAVGAGERGTHPRTQSAHAAGLGRARSFDSAGGRRALQERYCRQPPGRARRTRPRAAGRRPRGIGGAGQGLSEQRALTVRLISAPLALRASLPSGG
jgi:pimeloyl-ACP methyl ester carboxylesterase